MHSKAYVSHMFVFSVYVSPRAVTTVDTSNVYQMMLMLILMMRACVVCVYGNACLHARMCCVNMCAHMFVCVNSLFFSVNTLFICMYVCALCM